MGILKMGSGGGGGAWGVQRKDKFVLENMREPNIHPSLSFWQNLMETQNSKLFFSNGFEYRLDENSK